MIHDLGDIPPLAPGAVYCGAGVSVMPPTPCPSPEFIAQMDAAGAAEAAAAGARITQLEQLPARDQYAAGLQQWANIFASRDPAMWLWGIANGVPSFARNVITGDTGMNDPRTANSTIKLRPAERLGLATPFIVAAYLLFSQKK